MKRYISSLIFLLISTLQCAQASQSAAAPAPANMRSPKSDCKKMSDSSSTKGSKELTVSVASCSNGFQITASRREGNKYIAHTSKTFKISYAGLNEVFVDSKNAFYINFLQVTSYANPTIVIYRFNFRNGKWLLYEMSYQASQSCNNEAGVDADYYQINYSTGKVDIKSYDGCNHFKRKHLTVKPLSITLETFDPSDERLSPFGYN
jgi:hypothetical protein